MKAAVVLILSLFSFPIHAELNLTLPPIKTNKDFCVQEPETCKKIEEYSRPSLLPKFTFKEDVTKQDKIVFYSLHIIDAWSTDRAISAGYARELNPLMPDYPSSGRIWGQKFALIGLYEYAQWLDNRTVVVTINVVTGLIVANNLKIIIDNEY